MNVISFLNIAPDSCVRLMDILRGQLLHWQYYISIRQFGRAHTIVYNVLYRLLKATLKSNSWMLLYNVQITYLLYTISNHNIEVIISNLQSIKNFPLPFHRMIYQIFPQSITFYKMFSLTILPKIGAFLNNFNMI